MMKDMMPVTAMVMRPNNRTALPGIPSLPRMRPLKAPGTKQRLPPVMIPPANMAVMATLLLLKRPPTKAATKLSSFAFNRLTS